jgi:cytochrome c biogenesis protein CcmG/thiol:disulfide interchange protein DsbE
MTVRLNRFYAILLAIIISIFAMGVSVLARDAISATDKPLVPNLELNTINGEQWSLHANRGSVIVLNFWATWCQPCKIEMPWLIEFQKNYRDQGFEIVGVAMEDTEKPEIEKFLKEMGVNYVVLLGKESVGEQYGGVLGLPTTFYIGRDGTIVEQHAGLISKGDIENHIKKALATGPGKP